MLFLSIVAAATPMLIYLYLLWRFDKNEPEPIKLVLLHFLYGATGAIVLGIFASMLFSFPLTIVFSSESKHILQTIVTAPIIEEIAKALLLFKTVKYKEVDNLTDGLVYGGAIGLGFGMTENFLYFLVFSTSIESFIPIILMRTFFSAVMHTISTATVGGIMSLTKYSSNNKYKLSTLLGLSIAILIHFIWNYGITFFNSFFIGTIFMALIIIIFIITFYLSLKFENKIIKEKLEEEIPMYLLAKLTSKDKYKSNWFIKPYQKQFIELTTKLAFRKHEVEISEGNKELYKEEIDFLKKEISNLVEKNNCIKPG